MECLGRNTYSLFQEQKYWLHMPISTMPEKLLQLPVKSGKGSITYIGVTTQDGQLERYLVREVYKRANVVN